MIYFIGPATMVPNSQILRYFISCALSFTIFLCFLPIPHKSLQQIRIEMPDKFRWMGAGGGYRWMNSEEQKEEGNDGEGNEKEEKENADYKVGVGIFSNSIILGKSRLNVRRE